MKFKFKALLAAVAFTAAGHAAAGPVPIGNAMLFVWDSANGSSFIEDLGLDSSFNAANTGTQTFSVGGADWTSFTSQASYASDNSAGKVKWGLIGSANSQNAFNSVTLGQTVTGPSAGNIANINNIVNTVEGSANYTSSAAGTGWVSSALTGTFGANAQSNIGANLSFPTDNLIGATGVEVVSFFNSGTRGAVTSVSPFAQTASFNGGSLTLAAVAAVPEPETYGMLAAGLLMLGAIARRRKV